MIIIHMFTMRHQSRNDMKKDLTMAFTEGKNKKK